MGIDNLIIIGDIHGKWPMLKNVCDKYKDKTVLGLGDVGLGFFGSREPKLPENFRFFRGNHDNPAVCKAHPQYTVDYGMWEGVYILAGADSIDKKWRTEGRDWWPDEQLSRENMELALEDYAKAKPDILICHEAPFRIHEIARAASVTHDRNNEGWGGAKGNSTAFLLDSMIQAHMPKMLVHGHWHNPLIYKHWGCVFISLAELEALDLAEAAKFFRVF
jgi:predicted phosphodiesterase